MNPVLVRELRARSRTSGPWLARGLMAFLAGVVFAFMNRAESLGATGRDVFMVLNGAATALLAMAGVGLTHDLVSRERREGTLGLLMLSPLSPGEVLAGKASAAVVHGFSAWVAMLPVLMLPLLSGGVGAMDVATAWVIQGTMLATSMAAGLVASAWNESAGWSLFVGHGLVLAHGGIVVLPAVVVAGQGGEAAMVVVLGLLGAAVVGGLMKMAAMELREAWEAERSGGGARYGRTLAMPDGAEGAVTAAAASPSQGAVAIPEASYSAVPAATVPGWVERRLIARRRRMLETDPLGWLLVRRRSAIWMVPAGLAGVYAWWMTATMSHGAPRWPEWVLPMVMSVSMAGWLREERGNGMLEVIQTTPCAGGLERTLCRRMWVENGVWVGLHGLMTVAAAPWLEGVTAWGFLPLMAAAWGSPWIGLMVNARLGGWWSRAFVTWVLLQKLPVLMVVVLPGMAAGWLGGGPASFRERETPAVFLGHAGVVVATAWVARARIRARAGGRR